MTDVPLLRRLRIASVAPPPNGANSPKEEIGHCEPVALKLGDSAGKEARALATAPSRFGACANYRPPLRSVAGGSASA